jgi:hypothetical protein
MRTLVYRPAVGTSLGQKAAPALMTISDCSKRIIQIIELLEERNMTCSFCLNKTDILVICGMTLLYQTLELKQDSKLSKDGQRLVNTVIKMLIKAQAPGCLDFKRISSMVISVDESAPPTPPQSSPSASAGHNQCRSPSINGNRRSATPQEQNGHAAHARQSIGRLLGASASETDLLQQQAKLRRMTMPTAAGPRPEMLRPQSRRSVDNPQSSPAFHGESRHAMSQSPQASPSQQSLDYLSLSSSTPAQGQVPASIQMHARRHNLPPHLQQRLSQMYPGGQVDAKTVGFSASQWEALLGSLEGGQSNVYDAIYGGPAVAALDGAAPQVVQTSNTTTTVGAGWLEDPWELNTFNIGEFDGSVATQSVLSMSDESLSPGEDMTPTDLGLSVGSLDLQGSMIPNQCGNGERFMNGMGNHEFIL